MFLSEKGLCFVNVDEGYLRALHNACAEVYYKESNYDNKPYIGVLICSSGYKYVIPLTSAKDKHKHWRNMEQDRFLIYEMSSREKLGKKDIWISVAGDVKVKHILAAVDIKKMIPVVDSVISYVSFSTRDVESIDDKKYKDLLEKEYAFCVKRVKDIVKKATKIYDRQKNTGKVLKFGCDFSVLEQIAKNYESSKCRG